MLKGSAPSPVKQRQNQTPLFDAVRHHIEREIIPFHVPGHKHGQGLRELRDYLGAPVMFMDLNSMPDLDDLCNPVSVIAQAQQLAAEAFGADSAFFLVNGTTAGIQAMMIAAARPGETIILPRNCHKSAYAGLILSGALPVYAPVSVNKELGISMTLSIDALEATYKKAPHAAALFVVNPSYYGYAGDLKRMVRIAHTYNSAVLVDEAHGCHMSFNDRFPLTAMEAGADAAAVSAHKTGGALTQASILLTRGTRIAREIYQESLDVLRTTSASYLLLVSLDLARKQLALHGREMLDRCLHLARHARKEINKIDGLYAFGRELARRDVTDFDETRLNIHVARLGLTGYEMERRLREEHGIQIELADLSNVLALITIGDDESGIQRLIVALKQIAAGRPVIKADQVALPPAMPSVIISPREAFYAEKKSVALAAAVGEICGEMIMSYPPGIPVVCPGEKIDRDAVAYIQLLKAQNCFFQGTADPRVDFVRVLGN